MQLTRNPLNRAVISLGAGTLLGVLFVIASGFATTSVVAQTMNGVGPSPGSPGGGINIPPSSMAPQPGVVAGYCCTTPQNSCGPADDIVQCLTPSANGGDGGLAFAPSQEGCNSACGLCDACNTIDAQILADWKQKQNTPNKTYAQNEVDYWQQQCLGIVGGVQMNTNCVFRQLTDGNIKSTSAAVALFCSPKPEVCEVHVCTKSTIGTTVSIKNPTSAGGTATVNSCTAYGASSGPPPNDVAWYISKSLCDQSCANGEPDPREPGTIAGGGNPPQNCGNGKVDPGEDCDDANVQEDDACLNNCTEAKCGDGKVWTGIETCDDGNRVNTDACTNDCAPASCGDGFTQAPETCDDGNRNNEDACTNACKPAKCGDRIVRKTAPVEECDDGNKDNTDACSNKCETKSLCGNGTRDAGEQCDDKNTVDDDGCSKNCKLESYCCTRSAIPYVCSDDRDLVEADTCTDANKTGYVYLGAAAGNTCQNGIPGSIGKCDHSRITSAKVSCAVCESMCGTWGCKEDPNITAATIPVCNQIPTQQLPPGKRAYIAALGSMGIKRMYMKGANCAVPDKVFKYYKKNNICWPTTDPDNDPQAKGNPIFDNADACLGKKSTAKPT